MKRTATATPTPAAIAAEIRAAYRALGEGPVAVRSSATAEDLPEATRALLDSDREVIPVLRERGQVIDALYPEIEDLVTREILLQAPVASDLRFLLSVLRIVPELSRSHHLVVSIAVRANHILSDDLSARCRGLVERMGTIASEMWRQAADSWYQRDRSAASALDQRDDEMDELHASLLAELAGDGQKGAGGSCQEGQP